MECEARSAHRSVHVNGQNAGGSAGITSVEMETEVDADAEGDDRTYCICKSISFGQMIVCDGESCETEWVRIHDHLAMKLSLTNNNLPCFHSFNSICIGLSKPPSGKWYCNACTAKQAKKRSANSNRSM
jgi:inhibitor of growth protein 3